MTPLGLAAPELCDALHHYHDALRMLMEAIRRRALATRFVSEAPSLLEALATEVEVDAAVRDLPEGRERMSPLERTVLVPLLAQLRSELEELQKEVPTAAWLPQLESLDRLIAGCETALSRDVEVPRRRAG